MRFRSKVRRERGQSMVELALTLPLLVVLLVGLVEVAFIGRTYLVLLEGTREGARLGARGAAIFSNDSILTLVEQDLSREGYASDALMDVFIVRAVVGPGQVVSDYEATSMRGSGRSPYLSQALLTSRLKADDPRGRLVGVEIHFDHEPLLGFPGISDILPDPLALRPYSLMRVQR